MSLETIDMVELDDRDTDVLRVLAEGRANPYLIRDETGLGKGDTNTVLVRLGRAGYVRQVTRGLYEITRAGRGEVGVDGPVNEALGDLRRGLTNRDWGAVEDAIARLEAL